jgi:hypothetical protein
VLLSVCMYVDLLCWVVQAHSTTSHLSFCIDMLSAPNTQVCFVVFYQSMSRVLRGALL